MYFYAIFRTKKIKEETIKLNIKLSNNKKKMMRSHLYVLLVSYFLLPSSRILEDQTCLNFLYKIFRNDKLPIQLKHHTLEENAE